MEPIKKQRGGSRAGAGRKRIGMECRQPLAVRVDPETVVQLDRLTAAWGVGRGQALDRIIKEAVKNLK